MNAGVLNQGFYVMVFSTTGDTIKTEQMAKGQFNIVIMPTPREISKSCGLAIRFLDDEEGTILQFYENITVPCSLYYLSEKGQDGHRNAKLLGSHA